MEKGFHGTRAFVRGWNKEVKPRLGPRLHPDVVQDWAGVEQAMLARHRIIHGTTRAFTMAYADQMARQLLQASREIHAYAADHRVDLDRTIRRDRAR